MLVVRPETPEDSDAIHSVNQEAFGSLIEASIVEKLRSRQAHTLSLVAVDGDRVIGHILFSPVTVESDRSSFEAISLAPMAVLPEYQSKGIGSRLVQAGLEECRRLGHETVVVLGHPDYYPRFGFIPASTYGLKSKYDVPDEVFMALELRPGALSGRSGVVNYQPEFDEV